MNPQSILSICIPTYNRAECLRQILDKMIPLCKENNILIYISDNASPDNTEEVGIKYSSDYDFIHYHRHSKNIGPDDNFEYVLKMAETKYRWLMSDTTFVTDIMDLMSDLTLMELDGYVVNGDPYRAKHLPKEKTIYHESISLMEEVGWHMTWISCMIYNERLVESFDWSRYKDSSFNQTALMFEPTANRPAELGFNPEIIVDNLPIQKESGWLYHVFDIAYRQFYLMVMSLPLYYPYEVKRKMVIDSVAFPGILNRYWHLVRRYQGKWSFTDAYRNKFFIKQAKGDYFFFLIVGICPRWIIYSILFIYRFYFYILKK